MIEFTTLDFYSGNFNSGNALDGLQSDSSRFEDMPLTQMFKEHFEPLFLRGKAAHTRALYSYTIKRFGKQLGRIARVSDFNDASVSRYLNWLLCLPRSKATVNRERNNLLAMWRFACRKGMLSIWPDVPKENLPIRVPQAWTRDEINRLFKACLKMPGFIAGVRAADWWHTLHLVCWDTGERIGAVMQLEWSHLDLTDGWLLVPAEIRKQKLRDRQYKLSPETIESLKRIQQPKRIVVFPWPYIKNYLWSKYREVLERAGLPTNKNCLFHRIRRSVASHAEAAGANSTELLGHSSRIVTQAYLDPRIVPQRHAVDSLFRPDKPKTKRIKGIAGAATGGQAAGEEAIADSPIKAYAKMPFAEFFETVFMPSRSGDAIIKFTAIFERFKTHLGREVEWKDFNRQTIADFCETGKKRKAWSKSYSERFLCRILTVARFAREMGILTEVVQ